MARHSLVLGRTRGFTLIEVLVALFIMAILASMAWKGVDSMVRVRDGARQRSEQTLLLSTVMAQWDQDMGAIQQTAVAPPLRFDGAVLRLTRRTPNGLQLVIWSRQSNALYRWTSPQLKTVAELQDWWLRSQQWSAISGSALRMLPQLNDWWIYYYQSGDNNWSNAQSSGNQASNTGTEANSGDPNNANGTVINPGGDAMPAGIRLVLSLPNGELRRDLLLQAGL